MVGIWVLILVWCRSKGSIRLTLITTLAVMDRKDKIETGFKDSTSGFVEGNYRT